MGNKSWNGLVFAIYIEGFNNHFLLNMKIPKKTVEKLLKFFRQNPEAMDTETGIAQWWVQDDLKMVQKALAYLMMKGTIEAKPINGRKYYMMRKDDK